jgi:hypothetical protein
MHTNFDRITLTILAALGLPLGCAVGPGSIDTETETSGNPGDGDGEPGDGDGEPGDGDGESGDGDGDGDGESGDGDGEPSEPYVCDNPMPLLQPEGVPTGFVQCEDGFIHRAEAVECLTPQAADDPLCEAFADTCSTTACAAKPNGSCQNNGFEGCTCHYGCTSDAECDPGQVCACAGVIGQLATCIPADCVSDADCGDGLCGVSKYEGCCGDSYQLACAGPNEECHVTADCSEELCDPEYPDAGMVMHQCNFDGEGWTCNPPGWCGCDCGRPFFVDGEARIAPPVARDDWSIAAKPRMPDAATRQALAAYWTEIGQFEHASIASFARFAMQLLALGAPPRLLADTRAALADEIEHARLAFGLASAYAGTPVGPGALAVETCLERASDRAIVEGLIVEACVGETLAAIEAHEAALQARDPMVARILQTIADDELRHARLGWRTLAWMLERADESLRRFALRTLASAITTVSRETPTFGRSSSLREHGVLDDVLRADVRGAALAAVIRPCAAALAQRFGSEPQPLGPRTPAAVEEADRDEPVAPPVLDAIG